MSLTGLNKIEKINIVCALCPCIDSCDITDEIFSACVSSWERDYDSRVDRDKAIDEGLL